MPSAAPVNPPTAAGASAGIVNGLAPPPTATALRYDTDYPQIGYADRPTHNPVARLQERLDHGEVKLRFSGERGYLDSVLGALGIDPSSQTLVYSKTSLQIDLIRATTPRAIYFDEDTYVAWIPETSILELVTMDSALGPVFYTLPNRDPSSTRFDRETLRCLNCHDTFSLMGGGVPRFLFMSSPVTVGGEPLTSEISLETSDATPISQRWGGWYVTGRPDGIAHLGNLHVTGHVQNPSPFAALRTVRPGTLATLDGVFDTKPYLTDHSDVVALLVFEHQVYIENLVTRANFKARTLVARTAGGDAADTLTWNQLPYEARPMVKAMLEPLVKGLLFVNATTLPGRITGSSGFDHWFQARGPRDTHGRSLRELDLKTHLFRYPLSYMIYSAGFGGLPAYAKDYVYQRLADILSGRDQSPAYAGASAADRATALEILTATDPAFAAVATQTGGTRAAATQPENSAPPRG